MAQSDMIANNSDMRKKFYRKLVKKINSIGGIRQLYDKLKKERRSLIDLERSNKEMTTKYFEKCVQSIVQLEELRESNLTTLQTSILQDSSS